MSEYRYKGPDTSDKRPEECWLEYWDRKRIERHGMDCGCPVCTLANLNPNTGHGWCPHTYENDPEVTGIGE